MRSAKLIKILCVSLMSVSALGFSFPVYSIAYEEVRYVWGVQAGTCWFGAPCYFSNPNNLPYPKLKAASSTNFGWGVTTTHSYFEYRSLYYYVTSSTYFIPSSTWPTWTEHVECRRSGTVNVNANDRCTATTTNVGAASTIWYRASTQWSGCGMWTPTPTVGCGNYRQASSTLLP